MSIDEKQALIEQKPDAANLHVMFVVGVPSYDLPIFFAEIKPATAKGEEILNANPGASCFIYQLRTQLDSRVDVQRKDFNIK